MTREEIRVAGFGVFCPDTPPETGTMNRMCWLIEDGWGPLAGKHHWLRLWTTSGDSPKPEWTEDASMALSFSRKEDAMWVMMLFPHFCVCAYPTEHEFVAGSKAAP